nr:phage tail protein [Pseudomonas sp. RIT-PI-AD]
MPPNATPLERAVAAVGLGELEALADLPAGVQIHLPGGFAPVLAAQYFLAQFAGYFDTAEDLLAAGLPWLRERGTGAAVVRALSWIGIATAVEEDGALLHLDPGTPRAPARLDDIRRLLDASIPAHVRFYRLFHGYDLRHARLDRSRWDGCLLDDDSGVVIDGLKVSFGERVAAELPAPSREVVPGAAVLQASTLRRDTMYWDSWTLDSTWQVDLFGGVGVLVSAVVPDRDLPAPLFAPGRLISDTAPRLLPAPSPAAAETRFTLAPSRYPARGWKGPWRGPWRLVIPSNTYPET